MMRLNLDLLARVVLGWALSLSLGCPSRHAVQVGAALPLTGEYALYGQSIRKGVELAFENVKKNPETADWTLDVRDSEGDPQRSAALVDELFKGGATAVIGGVITDEALASVPVADHYGRVLLSPSASSAQLTGASKNFYRVFISDGKEGSAMAQFAAGDLEARTVVVLAKQTTYAQGIKDVFSEHFGDLGGELLEVIEYPDGGGDLTGLIERATTLEPDAVYLAGYAQDIGDMIRGLRQRRFAGYIMTTAAFAAPEVIERVGTDAEGVFLTRTEFDPTSEDETVSRFVAGYRERNGLTPDLYAAHGYDAMKVLAAGIEGAEGPSEVWSSLRALRDFQGVTGALQFDERGDVQKFPRVFRIKDGVMVDHKKEKITEQEEIRKKIEALRKKIAAANKQ
jgi:branched-chain amino acid transport system substrate-binding protein